MKRIIGFMSKKNKKSNYHPSFFEGIAHRGLHGNGVSENSLLAFEKAINAGSAFELDIHLTKDGELVVCHDHDLKRVTGKEGIIENMTLEEISSYKLLDGQKIPTFQEVLDLNKERSLIVVELKVYKDNYKALRKKAMEALAQIKDDKKIVIISFDPRALLHIGKRFKRQLLITPEHDWVWKLRGFYDSVDIEANMSKRKEVIRYRKNGGIVNVWTIETMEQAKDLLPYVDTMTYQFIEPKEVKELLSGSEKAK